MAGSITLDADFVVEWLQTVTVAISLSDSGETSSLFSSRGRMRCITTGREILWHMFFPGYFRALIANLDVEQAGEGAFPRYRGE